MIIRNESRSSKALLAAFAVAYAAIVAELLDISRIPRTFVHRDYITFEVVFVASLWLCMLASLKLQARLAQHSATAFLGYGLFSGVIAGLVATLGLLSLTLVTRRGESPVDYLLSWQGIADFAWSATVISFGWLIGIISGAVCICLFGRKIRWLIGFAAFCVFTRVCLIVFHLIRHERLW